MNLFDYLLLLTCAYAFDTKPCITCKHFIKTGHNVYGKCKKFPIIQDAKYGYIKHEYIDYHYCFSARTIGFMCSEDAKHYEKIELMTTKTNMDKNESN